MESLSKFVGSKIREYRQKKGLTQKELGVKIGVKHNTVSAYERGTISPEQDILFKISRVLDVTLDDLFPLQDGKKSLDQAVSLSDAQLDLDDMDFMNKLMMQAQSLEGEDRKRFFDNIRFAVDFFNKSNE